MLVSRADFATYVQNLNQTTGFNVTLPEICKSDICNALWGDGNADISGIRVRELVNEDNFTDEELADDRGDISAHQY